MASTTADKTPISLANLARNNDNMKEYIQGEIDKIPTGGSITIDDALSDTSENPVQNKVINAALVNKADNSHTHAKSEITDFPTTGTASTAGLTKLYIQKGTNTDGTMTQNAITNALNNKTDIGYTRLLAPKESINYDINSESYLVAGLYEGIGFTLLNCPTEEEFIMTVEGFRYDDCVEFDNWANVKRIRTIKTITNEIYTQYVYKETVEGDFVYGEWVKMANNARKYTVSISASESWTSGTSCKYITKTVTGLKTTDDIDITPVLSTSDHAAAALQLEAYKCILNGNIVISANDTIIIYCYGNTPTTALTLDIMTKE